MAMREDARRAFLKTAPAKTFLEAPDDVREQWLTTSHVPSNVVDQVRIADREIPRHVRIELADPRRTWIRSSGIEITAAQGDALIAAGLGSNVRRGEGMPERRARKATREDHELYGARADFELVRGDVMDCLAFSPSFPQLVRVPAWEALLEVDRVLAAEVAAKRVIVHYQTPEEDYAFALETLREMTPFERDCYLATLPKKDS